MSRSLSIDVATVSSVEELHVLLARAMRFPDFYGKNWDAFWDCITDPSLSELGSRINIRGMDQLQERLPVAADKLRECLQELSGVRHDIMICIESSSSASGAAG